MKKTKNEAWKCYEIQVRIQVLVQNAKNIQKSDKNCSKKVQFTPDLSKRAQCRYKIVQKVSFLTILAETGSEDHVTTDT